MSSKFGSAKKRKHWKEHISINNTGWSNIVRWLGQTGTPTIITAGGSFPCQVQYIILASWQAKARKENLWCPELQSKVHHSTGKKKKAE